MATVDEILTRQAYAAGDETWTKDNNYPSYTLYVEPEYVTVTNKRIADFNDQISVRGERNAQFVGFQMPRYDDGLDLTAAHLYIHYQTVYGGSDSIPCNVSWSDNHVRMCWQVPAQATQEPDRVQMMIYATGTNSAGERVTWKTLPTSYTIHDGLDIGGGIPEPDLSWYEQFVAQMEAQVSTAQGHANDAQVSKTAAAGSATAAAESATASAQALEDNKAYVESQKETFVGYNKRETDLKYANALIGTASGMGRVTVGDAWEAPIPDLEIAGMSGQFSTTGAQMLDIPSLSARTSNGVTFTPNPDGAILAAGTATGGNSTFYLSDRLSVPSGDYYISGCPDGGDKSTYVIKGYINTSDGTSYAYAYDIGDGDTLTVKDGQTLSLAITIGNNASGPLVFRPMLHAGSTPKPWEPYTGGKPSPSPEYPQEIVSTDVAAVTVTGANNQSKTATIPLTEPLRGIGDYRDRIMCRDGVWGIERQFVSLTFDGSEDENWGNITTNTDEKKRLMPNGIFGLKPTNTLVASPGLSNLFSAFIPAGNAGTFGANNGISIDNAGNLIVYCEKYNTVNSLPAWKEFLQSNNLIVVAPLATPTWEPLPSATQSALNALTTYTGTTHVTITAGGPEPDVGLGYVQDTRAVVADLQAQINEIRGGTT